MRMLSCTLMLLVAATTATAAEVDEAIKEARAAL
jgi:hypothetical protein